MSEQENSSTANGSDARKGLSKEAWIAISTIAAALITGIVTLVIGLSPKPAPNSATPLATASVVSSPTPTPATVTADSIAGKWFGTAKDENGVFEIRLEVRKGCSINEKCGSMSISNTPCEGYISLERAHDPTFEFNVDNFYGNSDREKCAAGAGEEFQLRPDGKLDYRTTYDSTTGVLERTKD